MGQREMAIFLMPKFQVGVMEAMYLSEMKFFTYDNVLIFFDSPLVFPRGRTHPQGTGDHGRKHEL